MKATQRRNNLMPAGVPRYVRCYDNGGETADRFTVIFAGRAAKMSSPGRADQWPLLAMSAAPFHPQGFGQHGHTDDRPADTFGKNGRYCWPPAIGRRNHLGKRIRFEDLPEDCRKLVASDYEAIWRLN